MRVEEENYLAHYGVKGQKWGVRKKKVKRAAIGIGTVVAGSIAVGVYLKTRGSTPVKDLSSSFVNSGALFVARNSKGQIVSQIGEALDPSNFR